LYHITKWRKIFYTSHMCYTEKATQNILFITYLPHNKAMQNVYTSPMYHTIKQHEIVYTSHMYHTKRRKMFIHHICATQQNWNAKLMSIVQYCSKFKNLINCMCMQLIYMWMITVMKYLKYFYYEWKVFIIYWIVILRKCLWTLHLVIAEIHPPISFWNFVSLSLLFSYIVTDCPNVTEILWQNENILYPVAGHSRAQCFITSNESIRHFEQRKLLFL
jgi:hypothetical protein